MNLKEQVEAYIATKRTWTSNTIQSWMLFANTLDGFSTLDVETVENWYTYWSHRYSPGTMDLLLSKFKKFLRQHPKMDMVIWPDHKYDKKPVTVIDPEEFKYLVQNKIKLRHKLHSTEKQVFDLLLWGCVLGLRISDLLRVKPAGDHVEVVSKKTKTPTRIKVPKWLKDVPIPKIHPDTFRYNLPKVCKQIGISNWAEVTPHTMRKTAVTSMLVNGVPERVVRNVCGFAPNSRAFERYVVYAQKYQDADLTEYYDKF